MKGISALAFILFHFTGAAQINCENDTTFLIPIVDLQTGFYFDKQGGLYPDGSNEIPEGHAAAGLSIAESIRPINFAGDEDTVVGKLVMIGFGPLDAAKSFNKFLANYSDAGFTDTCFKIINSCFDNYDLHDMINAASDELFWSDVTEKLQDENVKRKQVQIAWMMSTSFNDTIIDFDSYVDSLHDVYVDVVRRMKKEFINLKILYISGLHFGGYISPDSTHADVLNEPGPYYNDFAIKSVIESQIDGDTSLSYADSVAPWICWGPNYWADGRNARIYDNLRWLCPGDFDPGESGYYLDGSGQDKIADALFDFLTTDPTSQPWIYGLNYPCYTDTTNEEPDVSYPEDEVLWITQNPVHGVLKFVIQIETNDKADVSVFDLAGNEIINGSYYKIEPDKIFTIPVIQYARGLYILSVLVDNKVYNKMFYLDSY